MPLTPITDDELRAALGAPAIDAAHFEAGVRERLARLTDEHADESDEPPTELPRWLQGAASLLPLPLWTGGKVALGAGGAPLAPSAGAKLIGYLTFPAICIFALFGVALFSAVKIGQLHRDQPAPSDAEPTAQNAALARWWRQRWWIALPIYFGVIALPLFMPSWLLFAALTASLALLLLLLRALARAQLIGRPLIAQTCLSGLLYLAIAMGNYSGRGELHLLNPWLTAATLWGGFFIMLGIRVAPELRAPSRSWLGRVALLSAVTALLGIIGGLQLWLLGSPFGQPVAERLQGFVDAAKLENSAHWRSFEMMVASALDRGIELDLTAPRKLLERELDGDRNPYVLSHAARVGLLTVADLRTLSDPLEEAQRALFERGRPDAKISHLDQVDWQVRALVQLGALTDERRDQLARRLLTTWRSLSGDAPYADHDVLKRLLRITELLELIERPIDPTSRRAEVHEWLRRCHSVESGGFAAAGGFKEYPSMAGPNLFGSWYAVQLMQRYGVPARLDVNWLRSALQPWHYRFRARPHIAALSLAQLNSLAGVRPPTWGSYVTAERNLLAVILLVALCVYATLTAPTAGGGTKSRADAGRG